MIFLRLCLQDLTYSNLQLKVISSLLLRKGKSCGLVLCRIKVYKSIAHWSICRVGSYLKRWSIHRLSPLELWCSGGVTAASIAVPIWALSLICGLDSALLVAILSPRVLRELTWYVRLSLVKVLATCPVIYSALNIAVSTLVNPSSESMRLACHRSPSILAIREGRSAIHLITW